MKKLLLILSVIILIASCENTVTKTEYETVYVDPDTAYVVGDVETVGEWVREGANERRVFLENGVFRFENAHTSEINYSGTYYAHDGQIDFTEDDGTEFTYLYEIVYDDPTVYNATIYMTPAWISEAPSASYRKIIQGVYEYP
jgi:hypothetical protein